MNTQWKLVPVEPTETMVINGFESEPDEFFTDEEVWEQYQEMSGCQQAAFRAKLCWAAMLGAAPTAPEANVQPVTCDHEWTDDGCFLLACTKCGAQEDHDPKWREMESAPRDGTLLRLLVNFEEHSTEDVDEAPTIGANNFENDEEDVWRFAGWCWTHDHFTQGVGTPIGWLPMIEASPSTTELDRVTAERDALQLRLNAADQRIDDFAGGDCEWSQDGESGIWNSACGSTWSFHDDGPEENGMNFCHSCGKHLVVEVDGPELDDDWHMNPCKQGHLRREDRSSHDAASLRALERDPPGTASMKRFIRRKFESWLILLAAKILDGRNVHRCQVVSRRDNNDMRYMSEKLEDIAERISTKYQ